MVQNYVSIYGRLSQAWLSAPLIILIIMVVKLVLLRAFINSFLRTAQTALISECHSLQSTYQAAAMIPEVTIDVANKLVTSSINNAISQSKKAISDSLTAIESLITFAFEMSLATYSCLALSAVNIGANEALNATKATVDIANTVAGDLGKDINSGLNQLSKFINGAVGLISSVETYFNEGTGQINNISLVVNKLNNLSIPATSINSKLESLRGDIPSYKGTKDFIRKEITVPFDLLKQKLNASNISVSMKVPLNALNGTNGLFSSFPQCKENKINQAFTDIRGSVHKLTVVLCALCGVAMLLGIIFNLWRTDRHWHTMVEAATSSDPAPSNGSLETTNMSRFAYLQSGFFEKMLITKKLLSDNQIWWVRFVTMRPLVDFLIVGLMGIIISVFEIALVSASRGSLSELRKLEHQAIDDMSKQAKNAFDNWRNQTNSKIQVIENNVNDQLLGWLYEGSQGVNDTLAHFSEALNNDIAGSFNGTMLYQPLQSAISCMIGNKIDQVEKGLTWIHQNSQIDLPKLSSNISLKIGTNTVRKVERTSTNIAQNALLYLYHSIHIQLAVSGVLLAIWLLYAICGCFKFCDMTLFGLKPRSNQNTPSFQVYNVDKISNPWTDEKKADDSFDLPFIRIKDGSQAALNHPSSIGENNSARDFDYSVMSWDRGEDSTFEYPSRGNRPTSLTLTAELDTIVPASPKSPIQKIQNRITRIFKGPAKNATLAALKSPARGSIHLPDDPATPLKAMIFW